MICCLCVFLQSAPAFSEENNISSNQQGIYIQDISVKELQDLYQKNNSNYFIPRDNREVPAIFLSRLPKDFYEIEDKNLSNELFIQILSSLALKVNEEILAERDALLKISAQKDLSDSDKLWLDEKSQKYDVFTRFEGQERYNLLKYKLSQKIDIVPPSLMIAIAGIETNWGESRFVKEGNALYREILWNDQSGMLPLDEEEDKSYSIKKFPDLISSMRSFALKINSNINYQSMRDFRAQMRRRKKTIDGASLASSLVLYSPEKNFIGLLDYTITFYELINVDAAKLIYNLPLSKPAKTEIVIKS